MPVTRKDVEKAPPAHIQRVIALMRQRGPMTAKDISAELSIGLKTARNYVDMASRYVAIEATPAYGATTYEVTSEPS